MALIPLATVGEVEAAVSTLVEATGAVAAASAGVTSGQTPTTWSGPVTLPSGTGMVTATLTGDTVLTLPDRVDGQAESVNVFVKQAAGGGTRSRSRPRLKARLGWRQSCLPLWARRTG